MSLKPKSLTEAAILIAIVILLVMIFVQPYFEAKSFNKFRDPDTPPATYWDAMFSELRVTDD